MELLPSSSPAWAGSMLFCKLLAICCLCWPSSFPNTDKLSYHLFSCAVSGLPAFEVPGSGHLQCQPSGSFRMFKPRFRTACFVFSHQTAALEARPVC
jgi:hypothetical protein